MIPIRLLIIILFSGAVYGNPLDTINSTFSRKEILELAKEASSLLHESNFEKSFITSRLVLRYALTNNDNDLIARSYNIIGANYEELSEYDKAILYYKKGLVYANKAKNDTIKNWINNNLGNLYCFEKKEYKKGIAFFNESLRFNQKNKDTSQIVFTKLNIAWAYFDIKLFKEGIPYLEFVNNNSAKYGDKSNLVILNIL